MRSDPLALAPVFILGNPKSGTSLVQSLLDGHPQLYVIPVELQFFKFPRLPSLHPGNMPPPPYPCWKTPIPRSEIGLKQLREEVLAHAELQRLLTTGEVGRGITIADADFDRQRFVADVRNVRPTCLRDLYLSLCRAFPVATGERRQPGEYQLVEKCPHMEEYAAELSSWFPRARFVHVLRNPYANLYSSLRGVRLKRNVRNANLRHMAKSYYFMERNRRYLDSYRVIRYEDVVLETSRTMKSLAAFLGISFRSSLTEPSIMGRPWRGNPQSVQGGLQGVDPRPVDAFEEQIEPFLVAVVNRYFSHLLDEYGYDRMDVGKLMRWLPMRWETPWHYWANRRLLWDTTL